MSNNGRENGASMAELFSTVSQRNAADGARRVLLSDTILFAAAESFHRFDVAASFCTAVRYSSVVRFRQCVLLTND